VTWEPVEREVAAVVRRSGPSDIVAALLPAGTARRADESGRRRPGRAYFLKQTPRRNSLAGAGARWEGAGSSARTGAVLAGVMTLALAALALLVAQRLTVIFLNRRRLAAWETAWSRVGPQWTEGRL
jgi:hypothetical protein